MSELDQKQRVISCPVCSKEIYSNQVYRHFRKAHHHDLSGIELVEILSNAKSRPINDRDYFAYLDQQERQQKKRPKIERTPKSMRGWDPNNPGQKVRSGPLGPVKR